MADEPLPSDDVLHSSEDFASTYEAQAPIIYRFLLQRTRNPALSEDLTSSVFEKAWRARFHFHGGSSKAWLMRITRNVLTDHWRRKAEILVEDTTLLDSNTTPDTAALVETQFRAEELNVAVQKLPKDMRQVIRLRFIEGQSCREVAQHLALSEGNVRVIQYRALQKLREYLQ